MTQTQQSVEAGDQAPPSAHSAPMLVHEHHVEPSSPRIWPHTWWVTAVVGASVALNVLGPLSWQCPYYALTGHWCPGCGSTRMARSLLRGDIASAWHNNALMLTALPLGALVLLLVYKGMRLSRRWTMVLSIIAGLIVVVFTVGRNSFAPSLAPLAP